MVERFFAGVLDIEGYSVPLEIFFDAEEKTVHVIIAYWRIPFPYGFEDFATLVYRLFLRDVPRRSIRWIDYVPPKSLDPDAWFACAQADMEWSFLRRRFEAPEWRQMSFKELLRIKGLA